MVSHLALNTAPDKSRNTGLSGSKSSAETANVVALLATTGMSANFTRNLSLLKVAT